MPCRALLSVLKMVKLYENEPMTIMTIVSIMPVARGPYRDEALILMSTPAGRLSLLRASIVLAVAWTMSITLL